MQLKCSKCQKVISISEEKIPRDKEKAMIKCPGCQQVLVFTVPQSLRKTVPQAEKTIITEGPARQKANLPKLVHISENIDYQLKVGKNIIGRDADISIPGDPYISRRHCLVEVTDKSGGYLCIMTDDGSISDSGTRMDCQVLRSLSYFLFFSLDSAQL